MRELALSFILSLSNEVWNMKPIAASDTVSSERSYLKYDVFDRVSCMIKANPLLVLVALTAIYILLVSLDIRRYLWFDELFTVYIADQPTFTRMLEAIHNVEP